MNRQFLLVMLGSLVVIGLVVFLTVNQNQKSVLQLNGAVTGSRLVAFADGSTLAMVDFEATNPSEIGFEIGQVAIEAHKGDQHWASTTFGKRELADYLAYEKYTPRYAQIGFGEQIKAGETARRMVAARFEVPMTELQGAEFVVKFANVNHVEAELKQQEKGKKR